MGPSDHVLAWRLQRGDREACRELIRRFHAGVYGYLRHLGADSFLAEDLTQETYARAWTRIGALRREASLRSWLLAIARNEFLQAARRARREPAGLEAAADQAAPDPPADEVAARRESGARLQRAVGRLETSFREAIVLHYFQDLSLREVGEVLGLPAGTVKSRVNRALMALRALLEKEAAYAGQKADEATAGGA